jgi:hypothetical protein
VLERTIGGLLERAPGGAPSESADTLGITMGEERQSTMKTCVSAEHLLTSECSLIRLDIWRIPPP